MCLALAWPPCKSFSVIPFFVSPWGAAADRGWGGRCARLFPVRLARGGRFSWPWRDTPEGAPPPACLYIYPDPVHSLRGGCYQRAEARTPLLQKVLALSGQPPRHGEDVPCAHRHPDFVVRESPWLVLPACVFTLHIYSAHLLRFTFPLAHLLHSTARYLRAHASTYALSPL